MGWAALMTVVIATSPLTAYVPRLALYTEAKGPGLSYVILKDGVQVESGAAGFAERATSRLNDQTTLFNIASNSKQFTAAAALLLEQAGKLDLEAPVSRYLPELPGYAKDVKVKHLVFHTSGLPDYMSICDTTTAEVTNADVVAHLATHAQLDFPAGTRHEYSNTGYVLLSEVVQRASGVPFPAFLQREIFDKLGMTATKVLKPGDKRPYEGQAFSYGAWPFLDLKADVPCDFIYGDGGIFTSTSDYQKWTRALSKPGALFNQTLLDKMFTSGTLDSGEPVNYGFGWGLDKLNGEPMIHHSGSWNGYRSTVAYLPGKQLWAILLCNYAEVPRWEIVDELFKKHQAESPIAH